MGLFKNSRKNRDPSPPPGPPSLPSLNLSTDGGQSVGDLALRFSSSASSAAQPQTQQTQTPASRRTNSSAGLTGPASPPPSSYSYGQARPRTAGPIPDFRQSSVFPSSNSTNSITASPAGVTQSPSAIGGPRSSSYKRSQHPPSAYAGAGGHISKSTSTGSLKNRRRAPQGFNLLLAGGVSTGKTSFLRTLLHSCELDACSANTPEIIEKAKRFGLAPLPGPGEPPASYRALHVPVRTRKFESLEGIEIAPSRLITYLEDSAAAAKSGPTLKRSNSISGFSTSSLSNAANRVLLSITDTPGLPYTHPDSAIEVERRVLALLGHLEAKYGSTLEQESRVQRKPQTDPHVHLCVYFVDPLTMLEEPSAAAKARALEKAKRRREREQRKADKEREKQARIEAKEARKAARKAAAEAKAEAAQAAAAKAAEQTDDGQAAAAAEGTEAVDAAAETEAKGTNGTTTAESGAAPEEEEEEEDEEEEAEEQNQEEEDEEEDEDDEDDADDGDDPPLLSIRPLELSVLKRLAVRVNVLPVIGKADLLTDQRLEQVQDAIKRGLDEAGISLGPFSERFRNDDEEALEDEDEDEDDVFRSSARIPKRRTKKLSTSKALDDAVDESRDGETSNTATPVKVIRLRSRRDSNLSNSASVGGAGPATDSDAGHGLAPGFGGQTPGPPGLATLKKQAATMVPFALISPEPPRLSNPSTLPPSNEPSLTRKYRWGSIHVLNPAHCDFAMLRTCLLQTHVEDLKEATNRKYEGYRSEMLQAIRSGPASPASKRPAGGFAMNGHAARASPGGANGYGSSRGAKLLADSRRADNQFAAESRRIAA
ncbi:hypothetical protein OC846_001524 [Tilletia horrida]|uniref:Septin-type G domain-containing protein n=1 Tax=Tilletia horrida TaxID=155126 RepID=A0AAN6JSZ1_9BASI|nr:hypothetical protein OC845_001484 [Tilletia horrida]KAK0555972.1 hypothetical protein OC846_001524 [Tilletia horrida]KAK0568860.1 hypothetical protein OC861_001553 [Tilletia horrida]